MSDTDIVNGSKMKEYSLKNKDFFLKINTSTGNVYLDTNDEYYYQIQFKICVAECRQSVLVVFKDYQEFEYFTIKRDEE
jgi:DUF4097 and DUF4098 domain-containing protein YvlB